MIEGFDANGSPVPGDAPQPPPAKSYVCSICGDEGYYLPGDAEGGTVPCDACNAHAIRLLLDAYGDAERAGAVQPPCPAGDEAAQSAWADGAAELGDKLHAARMALLHAAVRVTTSPAAPPAAAPPDVATYADALVWLERNVPDGVRLVAQALAAASLPASAPAPFAAPREELAALAEEAERRRKEMRALYEKTRGGDAIAQVTARLAREKEKVHRDYADRIRFLLTAPPKPRDVPSDLRTRVLALQAQAAKCALDHGHEDEAHDCGHSDFETCIWKLHLAAADLLKDLPAEPAPSSAGAPESDAILGGDGTAAFAPAPAPEETARAKALAEALDIAEGERDLRLALAKETRATDRDGYNRHRAMAAAHIADGIRALCDAPAPAAPEDRLQAAAVAADIRALSDEGAAMCPEHGTAIRLCPHGSPPPPPDRWATLVTEGEAAGCYPCDTCNGFRAKGSPCQFCAAKLAAPSPSSAEAVEAMARALHQGINAWDAGSAPARKAALNAMMDALQAWTRRPDGPDPLPNQPGHTHPWIDDDGLGKQTVAGCPGCGRSSAEPSAEVPEEVREAIETLAQKYDRLQAVYVAADIRALLRALRKGA